VFGFQVSALAKENALSRNFHQANSFTEHAKLGVAVTFQACLQLECDGMVVLGQLGSDVSVSQT